MKVSLLKQSKERVQFVLSDASTALANALRRIMISEVPTLAVDHCNIQDNTSVLFDEILSHRVGLIPLEFPAGKLKADQEVVLALEKTGPCIVYAKDFKISHKDVKPVHPDAVVVELLPEQAVKLDAVARIGLGKEHAKWQAANVGYQHYPQVEVNNATKAKKYISENGIVSLSTKSGVAVEDPTQVDVIGLEDPEGSFKVTGNPKKFVFTVETISGLEPKEIILQAVSILGEKAEELKKQLKELK